MDKQTVVFSSRAEFAAQLRDIFARAHLTLDLFDPDFSLWTLETAETASLLRTFLLGKGRLRLVAHTNNYIERQCPRFLNLLRDFGPTVDCRLSSKNLQLLTDSFCVADGRHQVRRFHADHLRGEAVFDAPPDTGVCAERFAGIWLESRPGLHANTSGL
jgi:hypothetical protein